MGTKNAKHREMSTSPVDSKTQFTHRRVLIPTSLSVVCLGLGPRGGAALGGGLQGRRKGPPLLFVRLDKVTTRRGMGKHPDIHGPHRRT